MRLHILDIVVYSPSGKRRVIHLRKGMNVITGWSGTGKTALISIVDYCLGATTCDVPDGLIRQNIAWYCLRLQAGDRQVLVVRKAPGEGRQSTTAAHFEMAASVDLPDAADLVATTSIEAVVERLSELSGIGDYVHEPRPGQTGAPVPVNLRHGLFFEIDNRRLLFHKQSEPFIPQTIRNVLPYFLGAVDDDYMIKKARLDRLMDQLKRARRRLQELEAIRGSGWTRAGELVAEAVDLGMIPPLDVKSLPWPNVIETLRLIGAASPPTMPVVDLDRNGALYNQLVERSERHARTSTGRRASETPPPPCSAIRAGTRRRVLIKSPG